MKRLLAIFLLISSISFAQTASTTVSGVNSGGTPTPIAVENDGRVKTSQHLPFTNGSADAQALLESDNSVGVTIKNDKRYIANKTTTNTVAGNTPHTVTGIANQKRITIIVNDQGKEIWVKTGTNDAGIDSGVKVIGGIIIDDCNESTVVSYYASESVKIAIVQE